MKRILIVISLLAFVVAAPALACGGGCGDCTKGKTAKTDAFCLAKFEKSVKNIDNGVEILFVTADEKAAEHIIKAVRAGKVLGCQGQCPIKAKGVKREVRRTKKGVVIVATSPDAEMVKFLQKQAKKMTHDA